MKPSTVACSLHSMSPCAPFTHHWTRTQTSGLSVCLHCEARAWCPVCRRESMHLLSIGTWIVVCLSCTRSKHEQAITHALEEVFA